MKFQFEKFTQTDASFAARATIRQRTGQIGFNAGAMNRFSLADFPYAVLYFDTENRVVGVEPCAEKVEGAIEIKHRPSNTYITAKNFLDKYGINYDESHRHELKRDDESGFLYFELAEVIDEPEEEIERKLAIGEIDLGDL